MHDVVIVDKSSQRFDIVRASASIIVPESHERLDNETTHDQKAMLLTHSTSSLELRTKPEPLLPELVDFLELIIADAGMKVERGDEKPAPDWGSLTVDCSVGFGADECEAA